MATDAPKSTTPTLTSPEDHPVQDAPKSSAGRGANWKANETHVLPKNNIPVVSMTPVSTNLSRSEFMS